MLCVEKQLEIGPNKHLFAAHLGNVMLPVIFRQQNVGSPPPQCYRYDSVCVCVCLCVCVCVCVCLCVCVCVCA